MRIGLKGGGAITSALIYTRVSKDDQAREGISLDAQLADCRRYAAQHGWVLGGEYQDVLSGSRDDRPQYQALLAEVRRLRTQGHAVAVVAAKLDRFGRRLLERVRCREELKALGVPLHSVREGGEVSDLVANILASVAQEEVRQLGERIAAVRRHIASNGWRPVGTCPWGYRWRPATEDERGQGAPKSVLDIDPDTAPYVQRAFEMVAAGATVRSVMRWVASLPSGARGGRVLGHSAVNKLVRMPVYVGRQEQADGGDVLTDPPQRWPALVDGATWARVQQRIEGHARMPRQASGEYLLTGLMRCPMCGDRMSGWRIRQRSPRYRCQRKAPTCYGDSMMEAVDKWVLDAVTAVVSIVASEDPSLRRALRREWEAFRQPASEAARAAQAVQALERAAAKSRQRLTDAAVLLVDGTIDKGGYDRLRDKATADLAAAEAELARLCGVEAVPALPPFEDVLREAGGWAAALRDADTSAVREVLAILVDRVVPVRRAVGRYEAEITWTPTGETLRLIAGRAEAAA
jgi:site-specific DNA recombinase